MRWGPTLLQPPVCSTLEAWLDSRFGDSLWLLEQLVPYDATAMEAYPVSLRVNRPANDTPDIIEPLLAS